MVLTTTTKASTSSNVQSSNVQSSPQYQFFPVRVFASELKRGRPLLLLSPSPVTFIFPCSSPWKKPGHRSRRAPHCLGSAPASSQVSLTMFLCPQCSSKWVTGSRSPAPTPVAAGTSPCLAPHTLAGSFPRLLLSGAGQGLGLCSFSPPSLRISAGLRVLGAVCALSAPECHLPPPRPPQGLAWTSFLNARWTLLPVKSASPAGCR